MVERIFGGAMEHVTRGLAHAARRHDILSRNVSNLGTPNYRARDLAFDDYQRLALQRERALAARALFASEDDYVSARLKTDGKEARVKLRLKGDSAAHLQGEKWSFRVDVRGGPDPNDVRRDSFS